VQRTGEEEGDDVGVHVSGNSPGVLLSDQVAAQDTNTIVLACSSSSARSRRVVSSLRFGRDIEQNTPRNREPMFTTDNVNRRSHQAKSTRTLPFY
jgi:hypothetical protein